MKNKKIKNKKLLLDRMPHTDYDIDTIFTELDKNNIDKIESYFVPDLPAKDALRVILYKFSLCILFYKERIIFYNEEEDLHQFRVNIRKSRAFLKEFAFLFPTKQYNHFNKNLSAFASLSNQKRDLDVIKARLAQLDEEHNVIQEDISQQQKSEHQKITQMLQSKAFEQFFQSYQEVLKDYTPLNTHNDMGSIAHTAKNVLESLHAKIVRKIEALEKEFSIENLHKIRIAFKKFRYLLEEFQHIFGEEKIGKMIEKGKNLQTLLGDFNDAVNQKKLLHNYFKGTKKKIIHRKKLEHSLLDNTKKTQKKLMKQAIKQLRKFKRKKLKL